MKWLIARWIIRIAIATFLLIMVGYGSTWAIVSCLALIFIETEARTILNELKIREEKEK